jgi:hypothetical protein
MHFTRPPDRKLCFGRVCLLQADFAVLLYNLALPIQTSLSFFLKSAPGSKLDKSSISTTTTTLNDNIG